MPGLIKIMKSKDGVAKFGGETYSLNAHILQLVT